MTLGTGWRPKFDCETILTLNNNGRGRDLTVVLILETASHRLGLKEDFPFLCQVTASRGRNKKVLECFRPCTIEKASSSENEMQSSSLCFLLTFLSLTILISPLRRASIVYLSVVL